MIYKVNQGSEPIWKLEWRGGVRENVYSMLKHSFYFTPALLFPICTSKIVILTLYFLLWHFYFCHCILIIYCYIWIWLKDRNILQKYKDVFLLGGYPKWVMSFYYDMMTWKLYCHNRNKSYHLQYLILAECRVALREMFGNWFPKTTTKLLQEPWFYHMSKATNFPYDVITYHSL